MILDALKYYETKSWAQVPASGTIFLTLRFLTTPTPVRLCLGCWYYDPGSLVVVVGGCC